MFGSLAFIVVERLSPSPLGCEQSLRARTRAAAARRAAADCRCAAERPAPRRSRPRSPRPNRRRSTQPGAGRQACGRSRVPIFDHHGHGHQVHQPQRQHHLPGQVHQLIEAEPRPAPADEHEEQDHAPAPWPAARRSAAWPSGQAITSSAGAGHAPEMPAAEEQDHDQKRGRDHVQELGDQEHQQLHAGVLGVIAADQFLLASGRSNGSRAASANAATTKTTNPSGCDERRSTRRSAACCVDDRHPAAASRPRAPRPGCPAPAESRRRSTGRCDRSPPRKLYLLLLAQPPRITP